MQSITVQLEDSRAAAYEPVLTWYYGAPTKVQSVPSEAGATYTEWTHENARIRLYQMYGLSALEVTPSEKRGHTVTPPLWGGKWIPEDIRRITSGMKKFPPLERAIIKPTASTRRSGKIQDTPMKSLTWMETGLLTSLRLFPGLTQVAQAVIQPCGGPSGTAPLR